MKKGLLWALAVSFGAAAMLSSCNKDDVIEDPAPAIQLDSQTGTYLVKVGRELVIAPTFRNSEGGIVTWKLDGKIIGTEPTCRFMSEKTGEFFISLRVDTKAGYTETEIRVDVAELAPPVISLIIPEGGIVAYVGADLELKPDVQNSEDATYVWYVDGVEAGREKDFVFNRTEPGDYKLRLEAENEDGKTKFETVVKVKETPELKVEFDRPNRSLPEVPRPVPLGRTLYLKPYLEYDENASFVWSVNGTVQEGGNGLCFAFTPAEKGTYEITVAVTNNPAQKVSLNRNLTRSAGGAKTAAITVECVEPEGTHYRVATGKADWNKVHEFLGAPGQFVNEGYTAATFEAAARYAESELSRNAYVSLGGFGGYLILGFDHSVVNSGDYDFYIKGNSFDGSSEPGIVYVMQDENGDGLPNDTWYELKGSEYGKKGYIQADYAVTYYKPKAPGMNVPWTDNLGGEGIVEYLGAFHKQDYYYPAWITTNSYTLRGTRLRANTAYEGGIWKNLSFEWGYADNFGSDRLTDDPNTGAGVNANKFKISNAVTLTGEPANLKYIDFVKVQTGVNVQAGVIGENSTEVFGAADMHPDAAL